MAMFMELFPASRSRYHQPTMLGDWASPWGQCGQFNKCNRSKRNNFPSVLIPSIFGLTSIPCGELLETRQRSGRCGRRPPTCSRWTTTVDVNGFSPDDITVREVDGEVKIHAKHSEGSDEEDGVLQREFRRTIKLPTDIDPKSLRSMITENSKLRLIAFHKKNENIEDSSRENNVNKKIVSSVEIEIKTVKQNAEGAGENQVMDTNSASEIANIDMYGFKPEDLKVRVVGSDVVIHGEQNSVEHGVQVRRRFVRSFTLPPHVDGTTVNSTLTEDGKLMIKAAAPAVEQAATYDEQAAFADNEDAEQVSEQTGNKKTDDNGASDGDTSGYVCILPIPVEQATTPGDGNSEKTAAREDIELSIDQIE